MSLLGESRRRTTMMTGICAIVALLGFAVVNYLRGTFPGIALDLVSAAVIGAALYAGERTGRYDIVAVVGVTVILAVVVAIALQGMIHAYFWVFPLPTVAFFLLGPRRGLIVSTASFALLLTLLIVIPPRVIIRWVEAAILVSFGLVIIFSWVAERQRAAYQERLEQLAVVDDLTGAFNRRRFDEVVAAELARQARYNRPMSLILFDVDRFKETNDTRGHAAGDEVLRRVAGVARSITRSTDLVARLGGDEFAVVAPETPVSENDGGEDAHVLAERLRQAVEGLTFERAAGSTAEPLCITISIGVAAAAIGDDPTALMRRADKALYRAKRGGRNRVGRASPSDRPSGIGAS